MFTAAGIGIIPKDSKIEEKVYGETYFMKFLLMAKDPYQDQKRHYFRIDAAVPVQFIDEAREVLKPGNSIQVRIGELTGTLLDNGYAALNIRTKWKWMERLTTLPDKQRKVYQDI